MQDLPVMYWIPKMNNNQISFCFTIASPVCSIKPLSQDIASIFKLFHEKAERYYTKGKVWSIFDFSTLYTKMPHGKVLCVLNEITDFAFKGGTRDYVTVYNSGAFWSQSKSKTGRSYSLQVGSKTFRQVIGIPLGSDSPPFFAYLFLFFYESRWLKSIKNTNYGVVRKLAMFLSLLMI